MAETNSLTPGTECVACRDDHHTETLAEFRVVIHCPGKLTRYWPMCSAHAAYVLANPGRNDVVVLFPLS